MGIREEFEKLDEIKERISLNSMKFCEKGNLYYTEVGSYISAAWVTGAWYAFQEQQKKIDEKQKYIDHLHSLMDDAADLIREGNYSDALGFLK